MRTRSGKRREYTEEEWDDVARAYREMKKDKRRGRLLRDPENGIIGGVCAGTANYLGIETWIVRLLVIAFMVFGGLGIVIVIYAILWVVLDTPDKVDRDWFIEEESEAALRSNTVRTSPKLGLRFVREDIRHLDLRIRQLETYVTSKEYEFDRSMREMG